MARKAWKYEPYPLDFEILRRLPKLGSMLGYHTMGATTRGISRDLNDPHVTPEQLGSRLQVLRKAGLAASVKVIPMGAGLGWQITPAGETLLAQHGLGKLAAVPEPETPTPGERTYVEETIGRLGEHESEVK